MTNTHHHYIDLKLNYMVQGHELPIHPWTIFVKFNSFMKCLTMPHINNELLPGHAFQKCILNFILSLSKFMTEP